MSRIDVGFSVGGQKVVGVLVLPDSSGPHPVVLGLHGFRGNKSNLADAALELSRVGVACLRIDLRGNGDSEGLFEDMTLEGNLDDAKCALAFCASRGDLDLSRFSL